MRKIKVILFDLWGTLVFGQPTEAITTLSRMLGIEEIRSDIRDQCLMIGDPEIDDFIIKCFEKIDSTLKAKISRSFLGNTEIFGFDIREKFEEFSNLNQRLMRWIPGARDLVNSLRKRYRLAVISNLWSFQKDYICKKLEISNNFAKTFFSCDYHMVKPELLDKVCEELLVAPEEILYIGDSYEDDIVPALNLKMNALKVMCGGPIDTSWLLSQIEDRKGQEEQSVRNARLSLYYSSLRKSEKLLFIIPPYYKLLGSHNNRLNLAFMSLSEYCAAMGIDSKIYHSDSRWSEKYPTRYQMLLNSAHFYDELQHNSAFDELSDYIEKNKPNAVIISSGDALNASMDSGCWRSALRVASIVRSIVPDCYIIAYGCDIGDSMGDFDAIIEREAEEIILPILKERAHGKFCGSLVSEAILSKIPSFDVNRVVNGKKNLGFDTVYWRRGCEGTCRFCSVASINAGRVSFRPRRVLFDEIHDRIENIGIKNFYFTDANFTGHREFVIEFCNAFIKEFPGITWRAESRFDSIDEELLGILREAGCTHLKLGLENPKLQFQTASKRISYENAKEWIITMKAFDIKPVVYLLIGGMWMNEQEYQESFELASMLNASGYIVSLCTPYPGTSSGLTPEEWDRWKFIGSHLDIRLIDYWKIPEKIIEDFFKMEMEKGREDSEMREFENLEFISISEAIKRKSI